MPFTAVLILEKWQADKSDDLFELLIMCFVKNSVFEQQQLSVQESVSSLAQDIPVDEAGI